MSKQSDAVKKWRKRTKERIVKAMGGECVICGYDRCHSSLHCHHIDESDKDFGFSSIRANCRSWKRIVDELRKCVLICANCHGEIHEGIIDSPKVSTFDEYYVDYRMLEEKNRWTPCAVCGKAKPARNITCSRSCAAKRREKVDWESYDLRAMTSEMPIVRVAEKIGVSDVSVRKRMKKMGIT